MMTYAIIETLYQIKYLRPFAMNILGNPGGWPSWLGYWSQGACTGLDWVCSPVQVLLPAL